MSITVRHEGLISTVTIDRPPLNLLDIDAMKTIVEAHREADAHDKTRVILFRSAVPGIFSNGLDPRYVLEMDPAERPAIFETVGRTLHELVHLGKPHICAVNGPAMAGGAILAIAADFRIFDSEHGRLSFSEPKVGLPIPAGVSAVISLYCSRPMLRDVVLLGKNMDATSATEAGLCDGAASGDEFEGLIAKLTDRLTRLSPAVMRETKRGLRQHLVPQTESLISRDSGFHKFVGNEFLGEGLAALVEKRFPNFIK